MSLFSVVIPAFNSILSIDLAIYSCLNQTLKPYEIIVIDDCSTDSTVQKVQDIQSLLKCENIIRLLSTSYNLGPATARNLGWNSAKGDYVAFLDSDDQWHPKKLECISEVLTKNKKIQVLGHCNNELSKSISLIKISKLSILIKNFSITPNLIIKKEIEERFDDNMRYTEDHDLLLRIAGTYPIYLLSGAGIPTTLGRLPLTKGGLSGNRLRMRLGELNMYKKFLSREMASFYYLPLIILIIIVKITLESLRFIKNKN